MKHIDKISMVITYIETNLTQKLDLDMVVSAVLNILFKIPENNFRGF